MKLTGRTGLLVVLFALPTLLLSHPHVWMVSKAEVVISAGYLEKIEVQWTFDELFTGMLLMDHDANGDGKFDAAEVAALKKGYFDNLKDFGYFLHMTLGRTELTAKAITNFEAGLNAEGRGIYRFTVPVGQRLDAKTAFSLGMYDTEFYSDILFDKSQPLTLRVTDGGRASFVIKPNPAKAFYGGQVVPVEAVISWSPS